MKICLINNLYKPFNRGGAERIVELTARGLHHRGHRVTVIATRPLFAARTPGSDSGLKMIRFRSLFYNLHSIPKWLRLFWHVIDLIDLNAYYKLRRIFEKEKFDLVITHNMQGIGLLGLRAVKSSGIKHIHVLHDIQLLHPSGMMVWGRENIMDRPFTKVYYRLTRRIIGSPRFVISPSRWLLDEYTKRNFFEKSQCQVLRNPVAASEPISAPDNHTTIRFLYVGHLTREKGAYLLMEAFKLLKDYYSQFDLRLTMVGQIFNPDVSNNFIFSGVTLTGLLDSHKKLMRLMAASDCLVFPSLIYENSPTAIYEAASLGLPFIASRLGGTEELAREFGGIMFTPGDSGDLVRKIEWFLSHREMAELQAMPNRNKITAYSVDQYLKTLETLLTR